MKKNIVFTGIMAAILGIGAANAAQIASKDYVDNRNLLDEKVANRSTSTTIATDTGSDTKYTTVKAVETLIEGVVSGDLTAKEDKANKTDDVETNKTSSEKYASTKGVADYVTANAYDDTALAGRVTTNEGNITALQNTRELTANKSASIATDTGSTTKYPTVDAVETYVAGQITANEYDDTALAGRVTTNEGNITALQTNKEDKSNKSTSVTTDAASDTMYPSVKSVKTYVDNQDALNEKVANRSTSATIAADTGSDAKYTTVAAVESLIEGVVSGDLTAKEDKANKTDDVAINAADSTKYASTKGVAEYVTNKLNSKENTANKTTNMTTDAGSTTKFPTVSAIETYVGAQITASEYDDTALAARVTTNEGNITALQTNKEDAVNKSTSMTTDAGSTTKFPTIAAVEGYAVPKPPANCLGTQAQCVLAINKGTGSIYWEDVTMPD